MFSNHNGINLKITDNGKSLNIWKWKSILLNDLWVKEEESKEIKNTELNV